jgi:hypothetical protein
VARHETNRDVGHFRVHLQNVPMAVIAATLASLRFRGDDLDPEALTLRLGAPPSKSWRKGEVFGAKRTYTRRTGGWSLDAARREPGDLDGQINEIFSKLTLDMSVWRDLASRYHPDLFVGFFLEESNEGIGLNDRSLSQLADRGVLLSLDVYGPSSKLRNIQIIDGAANATFSIFQATYEEFREIFPAPGQDMEIAEDFASRVGETRPAQILQPIWQRPILKRDANRIDGTLYYDYEHKRQYLPTSKREVDFDESGINAAQRKLFAEKR